MSIQKFTENKKIIYDGFIYLIENEDDIEKRFINFTIILQDQKIKENPNDLRLFLHMISSITNNHCRTHIDEFFEKILISLKYELKQFYSNKTLFNIFKNNKRILLFLIKEKLIDIDRYFINQIACPKYVDRKYPQFFSLEIKQYINEKWFPSTKLIDYICNELPADFEENRLKGENENYVCQMIRNDSITEFVVYVNKNNYSLNSYINPSDYETNSFILENETTTLIEYAAFFDSIQIFQYLRLNKVGLTSSLWLYAIHGKNSELINILEEGNVGPDDKSFRKCFKEAIKCHHNEIAIYIKENFVRENFYYENKFSNDIFISYCFNYYNINLLQEKLNPKFLFFYFCQFDTYLLSFFF